MNYEKINNQLWIYFSNEQYSSSRMVIIYIWAVLESMIWFMAPDFLLAVCIFYDRKKWHHYILAAGAGSFSGSLVWYAICLHFPDVAGSLLSHIPFIQDWMHVAVSHYFISYGADSGIFQSFSYISGKLWIFLASQENFSFALFFSLMMMSRYVRFVWTGIKSYLAGYYLSKYTYKHVVMGLVTFIIGSLTFLYIMET